MEEVTLTAASETVPTTTSTEQTTTEPMDLSETTEQKPRSVPRKTCFNCLSGKKCYRKNPTYFHISAKAFPLISSDVHGILGMRLAAIADGRVTEGNTNAYRKFYRSREMPEGGIPQCAFCHAGTCTKTTNGFFHLHNNVIPLSCEELGKAYDIIVAREKKAKEIDIADKFLNDRKKSKEDGKEEMNDDNTKQTFVVKITNATHNVTETF